MARPASRHREKVTFLHRFGSQELLEAPHIDTHKHLIIPRADSPTLELSILIILVNAQSDTSIYVTSHELLSCLLLSVILQSLLAQLLTHIVRFPTIRALSPDSTTEFEENAIETNSQLVHHLEGVAFQRYALGHRGAG
jgi:hypothetical protein